MKNCIIQFFFLFLHKNQKSLIQKQTKMKRIYSILSILMCFVSSIFAEEVVNNDTIHSLEGVSVVSVYRNRINVGSLISNTELQKVNVGQGPDYVFNRLPSIFAYNDNGTNMGYTYYRMCGISCSMESVMSER